MAVSRTKERELIRNHYLNLITDYLTSLGEDVLLTKSNTIALPVVGCEGNDDFLVLAFSVPTGSNKGADPYDGYAEAESYQMKLKDKEEKAKVAAEKKAKKMAKDAEIRRKKAEAKAKAEAKTEAE